MKIARQIVVFDAADLTAESTFSAGLLGGTVDAEDDWHSVYVDGKPRLGIQLAPNHVPPEWPDGTRQQIHLDLFVDDVKAAHDEIMSLGARLLKPADDIESTEGLPGLRGSRRASLLPLLGLTLPGSEPCASADRRSSAAVST